MVNEDEPRAVIIVEGGNVADTSGGVQKSVAGETVFKRDVVFFENRTAV